MPNKKQIIAQTRPKRSADEANRAKDQNKKQKREKGVYASFLIFRNINVLRHPEELLSLVDNLISQHQNKGEEWDRVVDEKKGIVTYTMMEKNLCLSIARHAAKAFKNHRPSVKINNPKDNEFYRITVDFQ